MKFISKFSNYRIVLKPGLPGNRFMGTEAVPGIYIKFEDGVAEIKDEKMIDMMKNHPGFGTDFVTPGDEKDPYSETRKSSEPEHNIGEVKFGNVVGNPNPRPLVTITPEHKKVIKEQAKKMLIEIAKDPEQMAEIQKLANKEKEVDEEKAIEEKQAEGNAEQQSEDEKKKTGKEKPAESSSNKSTFNDFGGGIELKPNDTLNQKTI